MYEKLLQGSVRLIIQERSELNYLSRTNPPDLYRDLANGILNVENCKSHEGIMCYLLE